MCSLEGCRTNRNRSKNSQALGIETLYNDSLEPQHLLLLLTQNNSANFRGSEISNWFSSTGVLIERGAYVLRITRLGRTALYSYSLIMVVIGCIRFIKWVEMVVEGSLKKEKRGGKQSTV